MTFTKSAIERMGFKEISNGMELEATFNSLRVYQVEGITLKENGANSLADLCYKNQEFTFGFGNSLSEVCQYLFNEDFADESKWIEDNKATPPFLIVHISPGDFFICKSGYWKKEKVKDEEIILTYDSFPEAKRLLKVKESKIIPQLIVSLSVHLSFLNERIRFKPILRETYGKTKSGESIQDIRMEFSLKMLSSKDVNSAEVKKRIQDSLKLYNQLDFKVSSFLHAALEEADRLKQFLNFFLVLEIYTHRVFQTIDFQNYVMEVNNIPDRIQVSGEKFFLERQAESKNLLQRFHWCALLVWEKIDDKDIEDFKSIKKIRDRITHGENVPEATLPVDLAEKLCLKLLSSRC